MTEDELINKGFRMFGSGGFPTLLQFETSTVCNSSCLMCPHKDMAPRPMMKWSTIIKLLHEAVPYAQFICPFLMQEPTCEPRLVDILSSIKVQNPNAFTTVYSNMAAMTPELSADLIDSNALDELRISFYGPTEELHRKWQKGLDWLTTKKNIEYFMAYRNLKPRCRPKVYMHMITMPELMDEFPRFKEEWQSKVDDIYIVHFDTFHGKISNYGDEKRYWGEPAKTRTPCERLWNSFVVHSDGDVVPCCIDYEPEIVFGNVNETSPMKIWRNELFDTFREQHIYSWMHQDFDDIPLCKDCEIWMYQHNKGWNDLWTK